MNTNMNYYGDGEPGEHSFRGLPQTQTRIQNNSAMVTKFLEETETLSSTSTSLNLSKGSIDGVFFTESEAPDSQSYIVFDQLWSSSNQQDVLLMQWKCMIDKITDKQLYFNFNLPQNKITGMFHLCRLLKTNFVIRFRALELYERYLRVFLGKMTDYLKDCGRADFKDFITRFESQILLRMCTCILIASKLHSDTQIQALTAERISRLLKTQGLTFSSRSISRSEIRVLDTLDFKCHWITPLDLVEQLLSILNLQVESLKRAHYFSILLLEYCYLDVERIRIQFSTRVKHSTRGTVSDGKITVPLQVAAIVSAALFIVSTEVKTNLHKVVAKTASLPEEDVNILAIMILDLLIRD